MLYDIIDLISAIRNGDLNEVNKCLKSPKKYDKRIQDIPAEEQYVNMPRDFPSMQGPTPLYAAIILADTNEELAIIIARRLIGAGAKPNFCGIDTQSPLQRAACQGKLQMVSLLLDNGASLNVGYGQRTNTPLHEAASNGHVDVVRIMVERGVNRDLQEAAFHSAVRNNRQRMIITLIDGGAGAVIDERIYKSLIDTATRAKNNDMLTFLEQYNPIKDNEESAVRSYRP